MKESMKPGASGVLARFGLVSEQEVALLLGIAVERLRHRPLDQIPAFFKSGRRKPFREEAVHEFIERNTKSTDNEGGSSRR